MKIDFYMIKSKSMLDDKVYVGQTSNINSRMSHHKCLSNKMLCNPLYDYIRDNGGWDNMDYTILESRDINKNDTDKNKKIAEINTLPIKSKIFDNILIFPLFFICYEIHHRMADC